MQALPHLDDIQQSWLLAETLKYFWLLFSPEEALSLDEWVLTTEAHPLRAAPRGGQAKERASAASKTAGGGEAAEEETR